jgi:hypothetical protein
MARTVCTWAIRLFAVLWLVAIAIGLIGTFGWFGQERDPLSWVFIVPLGVPWTSMLANVSDTASLWLAVLAPLLNLAILSGLCRLIGGRTT